jgi:predicted RNA-binding protein YlqC (UPF0109 family)
VTESENLTGSLAATPDMRTLMAEIAQALVDDASAVRIESFVDGDSTVLRLHVAASDIGKVIGKQGRTARSLRTILAAASMKLHHRYALDIVEAGDSNAPNIDAD